MIDLRGQRFGYLTVIERDKSVGGKGKHLKWVCQCDCGNIKSIAGESLRKGRTQSCGCYNKKRTSERNSKDIDMIGKVFGRLTVLKSVELTDHGYTYLCKCECGNETTVLGTSLRLNLTKSCGCYQKEQVKKATSKVDDTLERTFGKLTPLYVKEDSLPGRIMIHCRCECGNEIDIIQNSLRAGLTQSCGCLKSRGEYAINQILTANSIKYKTQYKVTIDGHALRFDFAVLDENLRVKYFIEYDGVQHYRPVEHFGGEESFSKIQQYDKMKNDYCLNVGIPLIRIDSREKPVKDITIKDLIP